MPARPILMLKTKLMMKKKIIAIFAGTLALVAGTLATTACSSQPKVIHFETNSAMSVQSID